MTGNINGSTEKVVSSTAVFGYLNLEEEVTLQCHTSQSVLGAALLQNGKPVAHGFRALSAAERRYAQIENEVLVIVFAFQRFDIRLRSGYDTSRE